MCIIGFLFFFLFKWEYIDTNNHLEKIQERCSFFKLGTISYERVREESS